MVGPPFSQPIYRPSKEKDKAKSDNIKNPRRVIESIDNVFRQHSQGNSDTFFRKGKPFDKFGQPHISGPFHKAEREEEDAADEFDIPHT